MVRVRRQTCLSLGHEVMSAVESKDCVVTVLGKVGGALLHKGVIRDHEALMGTMHC